VAVQVAAGTAAVFSAFPNSPINRPAIITAISIGVVLLMLYLNLRGIREAGKAFAIPTYLFSAVVIIMIIVGVGREIFGTLPRVHIPPGADVYGAHVSHTTSSLITFGMVFVLLRAFANGGSSLTGIEAVSNAVSAFRPPEGLNARKVLVTEGIILGTLVAGISWLAHLTHATPYVSGVPTVLSQEAKVVFGSSFAGHAMLFIVQAATALILYTGGNTSFNGFPFLANFVAEDAFLPRWLTKRGHRLVFSNGIVVLAIVSITLLGVVGSNVNRLVPFYALGVFTAFTMAGFGMAKYFHRTRGQGWRYKFVINFAAGVTSLVVVLIFVVVKFSEGAWVVVVLFAIGVPVLIRLNRQYRMEATVLEGIGSRGKPPDPPTYSRRTVYVFIDDFDLATIAGLRYARSLRPTSLRAVHFVIDNVQADKLRQDWMRASPGIPLDFVDCPDRRLAIAAANLVSADAVLPGVGVTAVLPRRSYAPIVGRLLHDRTADKMASLISRIPHAAATIVPFDVGSRVESLARRGPAAQPAATGPVSPEQAQPVDQAQADLPSAGQPLPDAVTSPADNGPYERPAPRRGITPLGSLTGPGRATVEGRVHTVEIRPVEHNTVLACDVEDATGQLTALFYGRSNIAGLRPGVKVRLRGQVGIRDSRPVMINPAYELLAPGEATSAEQQEQQDNQSRRGRNRRDDQQT
jgi:amino acid transporter